MSNISLERKFAALDVGPHGTYDLAGNVREWVIKSVGDNRFILGEHGIRGPIRIWSRRPFRHSSIGVLAKRPSSCCYPV